MRNLALYQEHYVDLPFEEVQARYRKRKILESLERYRPRSILEIGCGVDPIFNHYQDFAHCVVVEPAAEFAESALLQASGRSNISVVRGTVEDSVDALGGSTYEFVLLSSLLHEIPDSQRLLSATRELCGPDTVVHLNVPNGNSFHRLLGMEMGLIANQYEPSAVQQLMQQSHTFSQDTLRSLVRACGFQVLEEGTFFIKPFTHAQMAALRSSGFLTDVMLDGLYELSSHFPCHGSEIFMNLQRAP